MKRNKANRAVTFFFPEKLKPILLDAQGNPFPYYKYIYLRGGRGGGKTRGAVSYIIALMRSKPIRGLVGREFLNSIRASSWQTFKDEIERQDLTSEFIVTDREIRHINGNFLIFTGLRHNVSSIKSKEGLNLFFCDEARTLSQYSIDVVIPTILRNKEPRLIFVYNPEEAGDPVHVMANAGMPESITIDMSIEDNPWASKDMYDERARAYREDPEKAEWIWGGQCIQRTNAQVFGGRYRIEDFELDENLPLYVGIDFGFAQDPTHIVCAHVVDKTIYIPREAYGVGIEIDHIPDTLKKIGISSSQDIRCDSARPETISYLQRHGYPKAKAASKWPGSKQDGISVLRTYDIIIHPRCRNIAEQARLYRFKTDPITGDIKSEPEDKNDHGFDALRYALDPLIRNKIKKDTKYAKLDNFGKGHML